MNIPYSTPFTNNIPPDNDVNMVNKTFTINYVQSADDIKSVAFNANAPTNNIKNVTPIINVINDKPPDPFEPKPPIVTAINDKPVDAFDNGYNEIVADGANAVD